MGSDSLRTIVLTVGLPASGKDTWCDEEMQKYPGKYKKVNRDLMREMFNAPGFSQRNENLVLETRDFIVERALFKGWDVIVCDTNFAGANWIRMCEIAKRVGNVRVYEKFFDVSLKECLRRNPLRRCPVPEDVIHKMYNKYLKNKKVEIRDEYFPKEPKHLSLIPYDSDKKDCVVIDMDGTLAINTTRSYYDNSRVGEDAVFEPIVNLCNLLAQHYTPIIVSGRTKSCLDMTRLWLEKNCMFPKGIEIYMRDDGDNRKDIVVKKEIYE